MRCLLNSHGEERMTYHSDWIPIIPCLTNPAFETARNLLRESNSFSWNKFVTLGYELLEEWCNEHCKGQWVNDQYSCIAFLFEDPRDAMFFKLAHG